MTRTLDIVTAVIRDEGGRMLLVRKRGTTTFMKPGGKRTLLIPADLGYGSNAAGGVIPPGASMVFDVELLDVKPHE